VTEKHITLRDDGELEDLARAVCDDQEPRILERNGVPVAAIVPIGEWRRRREWNPSDEDIQRSLSAAGGWKGLVDDDLADQVMRTRHEQPIRPPVVW
jgi:PHD/YefM family antitoxin component YafN of YafNO toxin-antitoxin module